MSAKLPTQIIPGTPLTALAPMQDVTDLAFMQIVSQFGNPDYYFTEYFRVYPSSRPEKHILRSLTENHTGRPIFAQMIGESIPDLVRTAQELSEYAIAGIDLNMGCPAPRVYKKNVGGGLLREPAKIEQIFAALRPAISGLFTVKMRLGFEDMQNLTKILKLVNDYQIDLLSLHGRTVKGGYRSEVNYDAIAAVVKTVNCAVLANGNISSVVKAESVLAQTQADGVMIGRNAIRNPWIFSQIRAHYTNQPIPKISFADVYGYIYSLYHATYPEGMREQTHVNNLKKYLNFISQSVDPEGLFLREIRLVQNADQLWQVCDRHLLTDPDHEFAAEPYAGLVARPSCETAET